MSKLVLLLRPESKNAVSAFRYTTDFICDRYSYNYIESIEDLAYWWDKEIDVLIIPYGFQLIRNLESKVKFIKKHTEARIIRFYNEYSLSGNTDIINAYQERGYDFVASFERFGRHLQDENIKNFYQCNVNCLIYEDLPINLDKKYDAVYWGTFRTGRKKYFDRYFNKELFVSVSSDKSKNRFLKNIKNKPTFISPLNLRASKSLLQKFRFSLYIEDEFSHKVYTYPANRYYEALKYGVISLFDKSCINTFDKYGVDISEFVIDDIKDMQNKIELIRSNYNFYLDKQLSWRDKANQDKAELKKQFDTIF